MSSENNSLIFERKIAKNNISPATAQDFFSPQYTSTADSSSKALTSGHSSINEHIKTITIDSNFSTAGCIFAKESMGTTWVLCRPEPPGFFEKYLPVLPGSFSVVIAIIALVLSGRTLFYNMNKDAKARTQSIQDDFWLRKVVSPASIEPFFLYVNGLATSLPKAKDKSKAEKTRLRNYVVENSEKLSSLSLAFSSLGLIDDHLAQQVAIEFEKFEDNIDTYVRELGKYLESPTGTHPSHDNTVSKAKNIMRTILKTIQKHQTDLGHSEEVSWWKKLFKPSNNSSQKSQSSTSS